MHIVINGKVFHCRSVEGFWQGLKCTGEMREHVFMLSGMPAKNAGKGKSYPYFEIAGLTVEVGSREHEDLIREAIKQKILQNPKAGDALRDSKGIITHDIPRHGKPIFKMERLLMLDGSRAPFVISPGPASVGCLGRFSISGELTHRSAQARRPDSRPPQEHPAQVVTK